MYKIINDGTHSQCSGTHNDHGPWVPGTHKEVNNFKSLPYLSFGFVGISPGGHDEGVIDGDASDDLHTLGLELVEVCHIAGQVGLKKETLC